MKRKRFDETVLACLNSYYKYLEVTLFYLNSIYRLIRDHPSSIITMYNLTFSMLAWVKQVYLLASVRRVYLLAWARRVYLLAWVRRVYLIANVHFPLFWATSRCIFNTFNTQSFVLYLYPNVLHYNLLTFLYPTVFFHSFTVALVYPRWSLNSSKDFLSSSVILHIHHHHHVISILQCHITHPPSTKFSSITFVRNENSLDLSRGESSLNFFQQHLILAKMLSSNRQLL